MPMINHCSQLRTEWITQVAKEAWKKKLQYCCFTGLYQYYLTVAVLSCASVKMYLYICIICTHSCITTNCNILNFYLHVIFFPLILLIRYHGYLFYLVADTLFSHQSFIWLLSKTWLLQSCSQIAKYLHLLLPCQPSLSTQMLSSNLSFSLSILQIFKPDTFLKM